MRVNRLWKIGDPSGASTASSHWNIQVRSRLGGGGSTPSLTRKRVTLQWSVRRRISPLTLASGNASSATMGLIGPELSGTSWDVPQGLRFQTRFGVPVLGLVSKALGVLS